MCSPFEEGGVGGREIIFGEERGNRVVDSHTPEAELEMEGGGDVECNPDGEEDVLAGTVTNSIAASPPASSTRNPISLTACPSIPTGFALSFKSPDFVALLMWFEVELCE